MKRKVFFLIMVVSLLASMLLISTATAEYQPGASAKFGIKLPDGSRFMNVTPPTYDIGDKFNITVEIQNVANMSAYGVTILWNSTFCNATGNWWLSDFFKGEMIGGRWSVASVGYVGNDLRTQPGKEALPPHIGAFVGLGQAAMGLQYNVTGDFDIVKIEFRVNSYGPSWFYVWKEPDNDPNYPSQPYAWAGLSKESLFPEALHPTHSGYISPPYPGYKQPYDVFWAPGYENVTNALLLIVGPPTYDVTIEAWCYNESAYLSASITMDGSPTGYTTPHTFTGLNGTHLFTVPSTDLQGHPFTQWSTGETNTTITVSSAGTYTAYYGERPPVGGIWVPVDKLGLLAPYVALASTILVATAATAIYVKRRRKKQ